LKFLRVARVGVVFTAAALALSACVSHDPFDRWPGEIDSPFTGTGTSTSISGQFVGAGASTQQSAMESWIAAFQSQHLAASVVYDPNGSGAGRTQFLDGGALWAGSDVALNADELTASKSRCGPGGAIDLPIYVSPIAVAFNLPGIESINLSPQVMASIFAGLITNWQDPAIAADNPGVTLPNLRVTPIHRTDNSGTTTNFTEYLRATAPEIWQWDAAGTWPFTGGESAQGTSGVINVVNQTAGAVTYADLSQVGLLGTASILVGGEWVRPTPEGAAIAIDASPQLENRPEFDLALNLDRNTSAPGAYPLVLVSYAVVCVSYPLETEATFVREFMTWVSSQEGQKLASQVAGSSPISEALRSSILNSLNAIGHLQ
jgi:phosphate transport system substrate-binding protein